MIVHQLNHGECRQVLAGSSLGRLACARDGQPYITPVFFYFEPEDHALYSFSTLGRKIEWMRLNPHVCVEIEKLVDHENWATVIVFGRYEELHGEDGNVEARKRAYDLFQSRRQWWLPAAARLANGEQHDTPVVYRVAITEMTGRRAARPGPSEPA